MVVRTSALAGFVCSALLAALPGCVRADVAAMDALVQPPELKAPEPGSLVGAYAGTAFSAGDVSRGVFALPAPFAAPEDRGPLLATVFPTYSPEGPLSEWGMGWSVSLAVVRSAVVGDISYETDEFVAPGGRLVKGDDGHYYPLGLRTAARYVRVTDGFIAYLPDGTTMTFGGANRVSTARGTFAWYLTTIVSSVGRKTRLSYARNASGRLFLSRVEYGGARQRFEYRVDFAYDPIAQQFEDFRPGARMLLDRRVKRVSVLARRAGTAKFVERWHYDIGYDSERLTAFYLTRVQQVFASGERAPLVSYVYNLGAERLANSRFERNAALSDALRALGPEGLQPSRSAFLDHDEDGRVDFEAARDNTLFVRTDAGFDMRRLPDATGQVHDKCRRPPSPDNAPRTLVQLLGTSTYYVLNTDARADHLSTTIDVCDRNGRRLWSTVQPDDWQLSATVRLADLDQDHRPEIVRVSAGRYRILTNTSRAEASFGPVTEGVLSPSFEPDAAWVHDFNGDSIPDLVARHSGGLVVWSGKGHLEFEREGRRIEFWNEPGPLKDVKGYELTFVDANKDGLADLVLTSSAHGIASMFVNEGCQLGDGHPIVLRERQVTALREVNPYTSRPVVVDLAGTGNTALVYTRGTDAFTVELAGPETGLLRTADDGRGTVLRFAYARAAANVGARERHSVLQRLVIESSGSAPLQYDYSYASPRLHTAGKFLVGFGRVSRTTSTGEDELEFLNDDDHAGLLMRRIQHDALAPDVERWETHDYDSADFHGIRWNRLRAQAQGWRARGDNREAGIAERTMVLGYVDDVCVGSTETRSEAGTLTTTNTYVRPPGLSRHMSCLVASVVQEGRHGDPELDFRHVATIARNDVGLVTSVSAGEGGRRLLMQVVEYDSRWRVTSLTRPGAGSTRVTWDDRVNLVASVTMPDGLRREIASRHPVSDAIELEKVTRGDLVYNRWLRFDGQERLSAWWDDVGTGSEQNPDLTYAYRYATHTRPSMLMVSALVDATTGARRDSGEIATARGERIGTISRQSATWSVSELSARDPSTGRTKRLLRPPLSGSSSPPEVEVAELLGGSSSWLVAIETRGPFGIVSHRDDVIETGVRREVRQRLEVGINGELVRRARENDERETISALDVAGQVVSFRDEAGGLYRFARDVLGRVRVITLPTGARHAIRLDPLGRTERVDRTEVGVIEYTYSGETGLLTEKRVRSRAGALLTTVRMTYDFAGRIAAREYIDAANGTVRSHRYFWDGSTEDAPRKRNAAGLLTGIRGDGYTKTYSYFPDGKVHTSTITLESWRRVETSFRYSDFGEIIARGTRVWSVGTPPRLLEAVVEENLFDASGHVAEVRRNGAPVARIQYDPDGLPSQVALGAGATATLGHDPTTRRIIRVGMRAPGVNTEVVRSHGDRGLARADTITIGRDSVRREYSHSLQGYLTAATDKYGTYQYEYGPAGRVVAITEGGVTRRTDWEGPGASVGGVAYVLDEAGRIAQRGSIALEYGPDGHLASARSGSDVWTYVTDEEGKRLLKCANGKPQGAYLAEGYLDDTGLSEVFSFAGRPVALLSRGTVTPLMVDAMGTVVADSDEAARIPSPFGTRRAAPANESIIDYVGHGRDKDLGLVRFGVRDYDPFLGRWTTADPLILENPGTVLGTEVTATQLDLFGYASGNPVDRADPTGTRDDFTLKGAWEFGVPRTPIDVPWMSRAAGELGVAERSRGEEPRILEYHRATTLNRADASRDETHWCSSFANWVFGRGIGTGNALAVSWAMWGERLLEPARGAIAVVRTGYDKHGKATFHVGFVAGAIGRQIVLLGGNQSDSVKLSSFPANSVVEYRWPSFADPPRLDAFMLDAPTVPPTRGVDRTR